MYVMVKELRAIPTTIITGFLGVGKTSAILHLLKNKPTDEVWAVLVNEYGSMGIDADILAGHGAFVEQVPGGCICCAQGLPFEVAINKLIKNVRPDRLIIEPSGLAHPLRIITQLNRGYFKTLLSIKAIICLVDSRYFLDDRYTSNEMFVDQIALADIVLANKSDLATAAALQAFNDFMFTQKPKKNSTDEIFQGKFNLEILQQERNVLREPNFPQSHASASQSETMKTWSETYPLETVFTLTDLLVYFKSLNVIRLKAVLKTDSGWYVFNQVGNQVVHYKKENVSKMGTNKQLNNRIEILGDDNPLSLNAFIITGSSAAI